MKKVFKALGITLMAFLVVFLVAALIVVYPLVVMALLIGCLYAFIAYVIWEELDD